MTNDTKSPATQDNDVERQKEVTKTQTISVIGWTASFSILLMVIAFINQPTWPVAVGVVGIATTITILCSIILKRH